MRLRGLAALLMLAALAVSGAETKLSAVAQWPQFRGPGGSGLAPQDDFPTHFGPGSNVLWQTVLPSGHSSPCIWERKIFLTGYTNGQVETLALDRQDGNILWRRAVELKNMERGSRLSNPAASTPATDGTNLYVYFGSFGLLCYDFAGQEQWRKPLPTPVTQHGASTSPVLAGGKLVLACDQDVGSHLLAIDARTGGTLWKAERPWSRRNFSTPLLWPPVHPHSVVLAGTLRLTAYDLVRGTELWSISGLPNEIVASPVTGEGFIFAAGWTQGAGVSRLPSFTSLLEQGDRNHDGQLAQDEAPNGPAKQHFTYIDANKDGSMSQQEWESMAKIFEQSQNALLAVRPEGAGEASRAPVAWKQTRGLPYVSSPLYFDGRVYLVKNGGLVSCFEAKTGRVCYQEERLGALGDYYSSPIAGKGKICVASQSGTVTIFRAGDTLDVIARNSLGEPILATPAIVENILYLRTQSRLYAFREAR